MQVSLRSEGRRRRLTIAQVPAGELTDAQLPRAEDFEETSALSREVRRPLWVSSVRLARRLLRSLFLPSTIAKAAVLGTVGAAIALRRGSALPIESRLSSALSWALAALPGSLAHATAASRARHAGLASVGVMSIAAGGVALAVSNVVSTFALRALLSYKGFLYGASATVKAWGVAVKVLSVFNTRTFSFQSSLPHLPVPGLRETVDKYLHSVRPLLGADDFARIEKEAAEFLRREGPTLQRYLVLKSWLSTNWLEEWWETYVYLKGRAPIMINSNFYTFDSDYSEGRFTQAERAASVLSHFCMFRRLIETEQLKPLLLRDTVPLCMNGYDRLFGTARVPGVECDRLEFHDFSESRHAVVLRKGQYFSFSLYDDRDRALSPHEIHRQIIAILEAAEHTPTREGEADVAALTAGPRTPWATVRENHFADGVNRMTVEAIETAMVFLSLDDETPATLDDGAHALIHGSGSNRWFDKSIQVVIFPSGRAGFNVEHAFADAPIVGHAIEWMMLTEFTRLDKEGTPLSPVPAGAVTRALPPPRRLLWDLQRETIDEIGRSLAAARELIDDLNQHILKFSDFGKGFMKKARVSPDAFIQMALQLAYYRDAATFAQTYESATSRLFRNGRTETIRSCSVDSCNFVLAMVGDIDDDGECVDVCTRKEKINLLRKAADAHNAYTKMAMCGKGIDRHLFGLYVISAGTGVESSFLTEALSSSWTLSTSQTPANQTSMWNASKTAAALTVGGGFGPVSSQGYGVSYIISGEDQISFHIASKFSCEATSSERLGKLISQSLHDMRSLFVDDEGNLYDAKK